MIITNVKAERSDGQQFVFYNISIPSIEMYQKDLAASDMTLLSYDVVSDGNPPAADVAKGGPVYRFLLVEPNGLVDSGATYPGCSIDNKDACKPIQFGNLDAALAYVQANNEIAYQVYSADEAWAMVEGTSTFDPSRILEPSLAVSSGSGVSNTVLITGAALVLLLLFSKQGKSPVV